MSAMSRVAYADPAPIFPTLDWSGPSQTRRVIPAREQRRTLRIAAVPLAIALAVQAVFFTQYWIPEAGSVPARAWWLAQLAPLDWTAVTSAGIPLVPGQHSFGALGMTVVLCGFGVYWSSRTRHWIGRYLVGLPAAVGTLAGLSLLASRLVDGTVGSAALSLLLMAGWIYAAGYVTVEAYFDRLGYPPAKTGRNGLAILAAYIVLGPVPTAVGRCLFAPELRNAAAVLQGNSSGSLRLAALLDASTVMLYVCGVLVGISCWVAFQWWPPRTDAGFASRTLLLVVMVATTSIVAWPVSTLAAKRVTEITYSSPAARAETGCGARILRRQGLVSEKDPAITVVVSGLRCTRVTLYSGFRQMATWTLPESAAPVKGRSTAGAPLTEKIVGARYDNVLLMGTTNRRDDLVTSLTAIQISDQRKLWSYSCADPATFGVRFAGVPTGDDNENGLITRDETKPTVLIRCGERVLRFDPRYGPGR